QNGCRRPWLRFRRRGRGFPGPTAIGIRRLRTARLLSCCASIAAGRGGGLRRSRGSEVGKRRSSANALHFRKIRWFRAGNTLPKNVFLLRADLLVLLA